MHQPQLGRRTFSFVERFLHSIFNHDQFDNHHELDVSVSAQLAVKSIDSLVHFRSFYSMCRQTA
jgi:hypothetical protein